jgi:hypothetical protein
MTSATIIDYMDDPALFAPFFMGGSWGPWRAFLKALFALAMDDTEAALYRAHTGRTEPPLAAFTEAALIVGRRGGKALALDTPLPTPAGWTTMGKVTAGDDLYDELGRPCRVLVAHPVMLAGHVTGSASRTVPSSSRMRIICGQR